MLATIARSPPRKAPPPARSSPTSTSNRGTGSPCWASSRCSSIVDLLLVHRTAHVISIKEAAIESAVWISIGLAFTGVIYALAVSGDGHQAAGEYLSGFLIEKSLSIDNVFVWAVIFSFFAVPREYQFRVLFWGIFGALVLRAIFIVAGVG